MKIFLTVLLLSNMPVSYRRKGRIYFLGIVFEQIHYDECNNSNDNNNNCNNNGEEASYSVLTETCMIILVMTMVDQFKCLLSFNIHIPTGAHTDPMQYEDHFQNTTKSDLHVRAMQTVVTTVPLFFNHGPLFVRME